MAFIHMTGMYSIPVCAKPTRLIFAVLNVVSAASTTSSPAFNPSTSILINGALSTSEAVKPITFFQSVDTIWSFVFKPALSNAFWPISE